MLSDEDRARIEAEEQYRQRLRAKAPPVKTRGFTDRINKFGFIALCLVIAGIVGDYIFDRYRASVIASTPTIQSIIPTLTAGGKVSVVMTGDGFTFAADQTGLPDQLNRSVIKNGTELCAIGVAPSSQGSALEDTQFFRIQTSDGSARFVSTDMLNLGGNGCAAASGN